MNVLILPADGLTHWFPMSTQPLRMGVFEVRNIDRGQGQAWFSLWDGVRWHGAWVSPDEAFEHMHFPTVGSIAKGWQWRGLSKDPFSGSSGARVELPGIVFTSLYPHV